MQEMAPRLAVRRPGRWWVEDCRRCLCTIRRCPVPPRTRCTDTWFIRTMRSRRDDEAVGDMSLMPCGVARHRHHPCQLEEAWHRSRSCFGRGCYPLIHWADSQRASVAPAAELELVANSTWKASPIHHTSTLPCTSPLSPPLPPSHTKGAGEADAGHGRSGCGGHPFTRRSRE